MKNAVLVSMLAIACAMSSSSLLAQPQNGGVNMSADEYKAYSDCTGSTVPADKAAKCETYLKAYPNSPVKPDILDQIMVAYNAGNDSDKALDAAGRALAANPNDLLAYMFEVHLRRAKADTPQTEATAKQAEYDKAASYAQKGLAVGHPKGFPDDAYAQGNSMFMDTIMADYTVKKDYAGLITHVKDELKNADPALLAKPSQQLQDMFLMANAYYQSTPPDYLNCAWYATRAAAFAGTFAPQIQPTANYCYKKFHGDLTGYDAMQTAVQTSVDPPAGFLATIKPAPKPEDIVAQTVAQTPELVSLAVADKEFILQYGAQKDPKTQTKKDDGTLNPDTGKTYADEVFDTVKGKSTQFPQVTVMEGSTADMLLVAATDDAAASKTADFTFKMKVPFKEVPATGTKLDLEGVYDSYTSKPLMITMTDGAIVEKKKAPATKAPGASCSSPTLEKTVVAAQNRDRPICVGAAAFL